MINIVLKSHSDSCQHVSILNGTLEPLPFSLLSMFGELGFTNGVPLRKRPADPAMSWGMSSANHKDD